MDAKKKQAQSDEYRETRQDNYRDERMDASEFEIPDEMESWALDDLSDLVPSTFD